MNNKLGISMVVVMWAYQDDNHAATDILLKDGWSYTDLPSLEKRKVREEGMAIFEFFKGTGLTISEIRDLLPAAHLTLREEKSKDQRLKELKGWEAINSQRLPMTLGGMQPLAELMGMPIFVYGTSDKYPRIPSFWFKCTPSFWAKV